MRRVSIEVSYPAYTKRWANRFDLVFDQLFRPINDVVHWRLARAVMIELRPPWVDL